MVTGIHKGLGPRIRNIAKQVLLSCLLVGLALPLHADNSTAKQTAILKEYAHHALKKKDASGYITAISMSYQQGKAPPILVYEGVNGIHDPTPVEANSLFQIGSITKSFISVVILQLAAEKHFSLDDPALLNHYFPEYPKWQGITLRELLNMTSGIPGFGNGASNDIYLHFTQKEYSHYISPVQILNRVYAYPLDFKPGTSWEYSNTNYTLLGQFIERVTHQAPEKEVNVRIIQKLGLHHTYFPINTLSEFPGIKAQAIVHGYAFTPVSYHPYAFMPFGIDITDFSLSEFNTAGAMVSTPSDINTFLHALYNPGPLLNTNQIKALTQLVSRVNGQPFNPQKTSGNPLGYGLGIVGVSWHHHFLYLYNGVTNGFVFYYIMDPQTQSYLVFGVNSLADKDDAIMLRQVLGLFSGLLPT